jgi:exonuclease V
VPQELPPQRRRDKTALPEANPTAEYHRTDAQPDTRAPLERFRTKPKKPLSVTDLVSPAWCELQYWYVLTKFGRKPQTQAMKQGSKVHRELEEQVHKIIPIQVQSKEDRFGLRIWNTIQGLRTLRETGLTRELEVWGVADGQVINGIIDEVSYTCPDPDLEEKLEKARMEEGSEALPLGQLKIEQAFANAGLDEDAWVRIPDAERVVYLADMKTRSAKSVPAGASLRPTWMQLMLYRRLLEALALNTVDAETIFARYNVQPLEPFTETFIREVGALDGRAFDTEQEALQASELYAHNTLLSLWSLMIHEFSLSTTTFSDVLRAEFRYSKTGELIGSEVFAYDTKAIEAYIASEMSWWKGERAAKGVEVEEAFKCRMCDFANECSWRKDKVHEATEKHRLRARERKKSAV